MFSDRSALPRGLNAYSRALARTPGALDLTTGNPTTAGLPVPTVSQLAALGSPRSGSYSPLPFGDSHARRRIAEAHGWDPERTVLTASTSEAYGLIFKLLCDAGEALAVPQPSYPLLSMLARFEEVRLRPYSLVYDGTWGIDGDSLREAVDESTKAVLVVSPNNPTGSVPRAEDLALLDASDRPLVVDEVFAPYGLDREASTLGEATKGLRFVLGGLSKYAGLPQMKLAWMHVSGDDAAVEEALGRLEQLADASLSVGTPVQVGLDALLEHGRTFRAATIERTNANLSTLRAALEGTAGSVPRVDGGWYAPIRVPRTQTDEAWALSLLERGVAVQPGYLYDFEDEGWLVVSLLPSPTIFAAGAARIAEALR